MIFTILSASTVKEFKDNEVKIVLMTEEDGEYELKQSPNETSIHKHLNVPKRNSFQANNNADLATMKNERSASLDPTQILDGFDPNQRRASSISSLGNWTGAVIVSEAPTPMRRSNGKW